MNKIFSVILPILVLFISSGFCSDSNFDCRFDKYELLETRRSSEVNHGVDSPINEKVLGWLKQKHVKPFFLFVHYDSPHAPYDPPAPYDNIFVSGIDSDERTKELVHSFDWQFDIMKCMYDSEELNRLKLSKNTLVILTADHGEQFLEHGSFFHKTQLYDELIHVPLIMRLPGIIPRGKEINNLIRHIDIMPTILGLLNIHGNNIMQGYSLIPLLRGGEVTLTK